MARTKEKNKNDNPLENAEAVVKEVINEIKEGVKEAAESVEEAITGKEDKTSKKKASKSKKADSIKSPESDDKKAKLAKLLEKAKKLEGKVEEVKDIDLKEKLAEEKAEKKDTLVPMEDYLKSSIHLGTRVITPNMRPYVYRRRADGLAVFNTALLDDKIRDGAEFLAKFAPDKAIVVCKREAGWKAVKKFSEVTGIRAFTKKYPAGVLTNTILEDFFETDLVFICDSWLDKNALEDAKRIGIPVLAVCDTNNFTKGINQIIPGNNKSPKSLGMIFYLLTKIYVEKRKLDVKVPPIQEFVEGWDELVPPK